MSGEWEKKKKNLTKEWKILWERNSNSKRKIEEAKIIENN